MKLVGACVLMALTLPASVRAETPAAEIELAFAGDVIFGGVFNGRFVPQAVPAHDPFAAIATALDSDLTLVNLETTVMPKLPPASELVGHLRFVATPDQVALLARNHIDAVTIANNHHADFGEAAVATTAPLARAAGLAVVGAPRDPDPIRVETLTARGWKVGVIAVTGKRNRPHRRGDVSLPFVDPDDLGVAVAPVVRAARADHDLVIVVVHWGTQYADAPSTWQVTAARSWIDAGADAVVGHHPHVLQAFEHYQGGVIAYSLGNFVFQNGGKPARDTGVWRLRFARVPESTRTSPGAPTKPAFAAASKPACLRRAALVPAIIIRQPIHHPIPATGKARAELVRRLNKLMTGRKQALRDTGQALELELPSGCAAGV